MAWDGWMDGWMACDADACLATIIFHNETYTVKIKEYLRGQGT